MKIVEKEKIAGNLNKQELTGTYLDIQPNETFAKNIEFFLEESKDETGIKEENQIILEEVFTSDYNVTEEGGCVQMIETVAPYICWRVFEALRKQEIAEYAQRLGIDSHSEPQLLSLARNALLTPLPSAWTPVKDKQFGIYYFNKRTGESSWTHPVDASLKEYLSKGCKIDKTATDTDSCVEDLKTEETFSSLKKESNLDSGSSLSNTSISSKSSTRKSPHFSSNSRALLGKDSNKEENRKERGEGNPTGLETKEPLICDTKAKEVIGSSMAGHAFPLGFPSISGTGGKEVLPAISSSLTKPPNSTRLTSLSRPSFGSSPLGSLQGSPNSSPARLKPNDLIGLDISNLAASTPKGLSSSGVSSLSSATNLNDHSQLKSIIRQPGDRRMRQLRPMMQGRVVATSMLLCLAGASVRDSSPEKNRVRFGGQESSIVDDYNSADEESEEKEKININRALFAKGNLFDTDLEDGDNLRPNLKDPHDFISAASKMDPWAGNEGSEIKKQEKVSSFSQFKKEQNVIKETAQTLAKEIAMTGGKTILKPVTDTLTGVAGSSIKTSSSTAPLNKPPTLTAQATKPPLAATKAVLSKSASIQKENAIGTQVVQASSKQNKDLNLVPEAKTIKPASGQSAAPKPTSGQSTATKSTTPFSATKETPGKTFTKNNTTSVSKGLNAAKSTSTTLPNQSTPQTAQATGKITTPQNKSLTVTPKNVSAASSATPLVKGSANIPPSPSPSNKATTSTINANALKSNSVSKEVSKPTQQTPVKITISGDSSAINGGAPTITRQPAQELELEESDRPKRNTKPMEKLVSKFGKKMEGLSTLEKTVTSQGEDNFEDVIAESGTRSNFNSQNQNASTGCKFCHCNAAKDDVYTNILKGMTRSTSEEDFLRRRREELLRQDELEAELKRKRELTLMSATMDIERSMGVLLKERQIELKREHIKSLTLLKEEMESNLNDVKREAEQKEVMERQQQMSRLNFLQDQYQRELEAMQLSHQKSLEAMKKQNEKELDEMKKELRRYLLLHKEEFEAKLRETSLENEVREILAPSTRPRTRASSGDSQPRVHSSSSADAKVGVTSNFGSSENTTAKGNYDEFFLAELKSLHQEISEIKNIARTNPMEANVCGTSDRDCKYSSKYRDIRKRYSSFRKRIKDEKLKQKSQLGLDSNSSTSSEFSQNKLKSGGKRGHEVAANDSSTESSAENFEELNLSNITIPGISNYTKIKTSTPKKLSSSAFKSRNSVTLVDDPVGTDWLTKEGNRILAQTENFLSSIKYSDSELEFDIDNPSGDCNQFMFEQDNQFNTSIPLVSALEPLGIGRSPAMADLVDNHEYHSLENISDVHTSTKSELDHILDNASKKNAENSRIRRNLITWKDEDDDVPNLISNQLFYQRPLQFNHRSDDMFAINNYLKSKWKTSFGGSSSPFTGRSGWPSKHLSQTVLSNVSMNDWEPTTAGFDHVTSDKHNISRQIENIRTWLNETQELTESIAD